MIKSCSFSAMILAVGFAATPAVATDEMLLDGPIQVNEGELVFLDAQDYPTIMHSHNTITISEQSLSDGVVAIRQCYEYLDAVPRMDIVYRYERLRSFEIVSYEGIEEASVSGDAVALTNVGKDASLCVGIQSEILHTNADGSWVLRNGPFHRKFFDGYFPFRVTLQVSYPEKLALRFTRPEVQPGVNISETPGQITMESYFAGMLSTEIGFTRR